MKAKGANDIRENIRKTYGEIARSEKQGCGTHTTSCCSNNYTVTEDISLQLGYSIDDLESIPEGANLGLGCGNPQAIASLKPGETVLDLGSGAGFDCFLASRAVGHQGKVIGVDMTPEMIGKARVNAEKAGIRNVEFRFGEIENLPVADNTVDVIISNCVINLSPEKERVFAEAYRVLKKGGRIAVSDIVATAELPKEVREDMLLYSGCISGAATISDIRNALQNSGFRYIRITPKNESREFISKWSPGLEIEELVVSASIEAVK